MIARLDVLAEALVERPLDVELLAESRGQQRTLISLSAVLAKTGPVAPVLPLNENPLQRLRRVREERMAAGRYTPLDELRDGYEEQRLTRGPGSAG